MPVSVQSCVSFCDVDGLSFHFFILLSILFVLPLRQRTTGWLNARVESGRRTAQVLTTYLVGNACWPVHSNFMETNKIKC